MNFQASKPFYIVVILLLIMLCLFVPKVVITPSPVGIEVTPDVHVEVQSATPEICVESPNVEVIIEDNKDGWTEETISIRMGNKEYPWAVHNIVAERYNNRLWIVTVTFKDHGGFFRTREYIFDEVDP